MAAAPTSSAAPRIRSTLSCAEELSPSWRSRKEPTNAIGTEPQTIQPTRRRFTVFLDRCTAAPMGRITTAATRSLEIAEDGFTPKSRMSIGVIRAPPPAPVSPTSRPTTALPRTMKGSRCIAGFLLSPPGNRQVPDDLHFLPLLATGGTAR